MLNDNTTILKIKEFYPDLIQPNSKTYMTHGQGGSKIVCVGKPGCFATGTKCLMFSGDIKNIEDVIVGDKVMGDDSTPRNVLELCSGFEMMYNIIIKNNENICVNENHILCLKHIIPFGLSSTLNITVKDFLSKPYSFQNNYKWYKNSVEFSNTHIDFDPYVLGVWIGVNNIDNIQLLSKYLLPYLTINKNNQNEINISNLTNFLTVNNLITNKHIPHNYKITSKNNRLQLLAGIVDTGSFNIDEQHYIVSQNNEKIFNDIVYVARSLGFNVKLSKNMKHEEDTCCFKTYYTCFISGVNIYTIPTIVYKNFIQLPIINSQKDNLMLYDFKIEKYKNDKYVGFVLDKNHKFLLADFSVVHNTGKCLAPQTPIIMFDGSIQYVENIKVGDQLMGDDSTPRNVLSTCSGEDKMYSISQEKGDNYIVNEPHILSLKSNGNEENKVIDISVLDYIKKDNIWKSKYKGYKVPIDFCEQNVPINPYYIGYFFGMQDKYTFKTFYMLLETFLSYKNKYYLDDTDIEPYLNNLFIKNNIPNEYKINSREIRLQFLAGLIDHIGIYDIKSKGFDIFIKSENILNDIIFIAKTLGFSTTKRKCITQLKTEINIVYKCFITGKISDIPCNLIELSNDDDKDVFRTNINIKSIGVGKYHGFELDGNHRFLLGDCTVTHNTTLIKSLLYSKRDIFPVALAISGTEDSNGAYKEIIPSTFVYNKYEKDTIVNFIKRQKIASKHLENPWAVILLDDCTDDPKIFRDPLQNSLYKNGRHWKMLYILSLQYCMDVRPSIRSNVDGTFILRESNLKNRKSLWENYAGIIPDFAMFCSILDQITDDYTALYIHSATTSNKLEDCLFWYKAKPIPTGFKFGCPEYWQFHEDRYNKDYIDPLN